LAQAGFFGMLPPVVLAWDRLFSEFEERFSSHLPEKKKDGDV
jgi:hypothetical protein